MGPRNLRGTTLIEVLVATVVLAIGLLGVIALQLRGVQSTQVAYQRTVATLIARDAVERLWVDLAADAAVDATSVQAAWLDHWQRSGVTLPGLVGTIDRDGSTYRISVGWNEHRVEGPPMGRLDYVTELLPDK